MCERRVGVRRVECVRRAGVRRVDVGCECKKGGCEKGGCGGSV